MRKYIIGGLVGFILATAAGANAQEASKLIDQVVQGIFPVSVEGNSIGDAVVIDNKTYLPVREFGESVGYTVTFTEDREVVLTKNGETTMPDVPVETTPPANIPEKSIQDQISELQENIRTETSNLKEQKQLLEVNKGLLNNSNVDKSSAQQAVDMYTRFITEIESRISKYEQEISNLQTK